MATKTKYLGIDLIPPKITITLWRKKLNFNKGNRR